MNDLDKQLICDLMGVLVMKLDSKYLGLPSFWGKSKAGSLFLYRREDDVQAARLETKEDVSGEEGDHDQICGPSYPDICNGVLSYAQEAV